MKPMNLKELYGDKYKITHDPAVEIEPGAKRDPWYFIIPCKYGHIYPYSDKLLAVWVTGSNIRQIIKRRNPDLRIVNWSDDGEAIFLFPFDKFVEIAKILKPKKLRKLSNAHREKLVSAGTAALKKHKKSNSKG